ncbi:MAG: hypothetical protein CVU42_15375 [Chloroflexi bacterium HGW-Chloroflexi-4]|jgi:hypothetical protein|nr:MAG: hypothetical protein CVU42_15375 [Chloroflexi bacterium HGW-Chloroflexi-4]
MAAQGWMLESVVPFAYLFRKTTEKSTSIRLDYKNTWDRDYQVYLATFSDAGWMLLTIFGNWHYFSINPKNEMVPEIYNSNRTKALKYRRLLIGMAPLILLIVNPLAHAFDFGSQPDKSGFNVGLRVFLPLTALLFIFSFLRVCIKLILLRTNNRE